MKLTSFRLKDKVHLLDLLDVGLIFLSSHTASFSKCVVLRPGVGLRGL